MSHGYESHIIIENLFNALSRPDYQEGYKSEKNFPNRCHPTRLLTDYSWLIAVNWMFHNPRYKQTFKSWSFVALLINLSNLNCIQSRDEKSFLATSRSDANFIFAVEWTKQLVNVAHGNLPCGRFFSSQFKNWKLMQDFATCTPIDSLRSGQRKIENEFFIEHSVISLSAL